MTTSASVAYEKVGTCYWNGKPEKCSFTSTANGEFISVTWLSDGKRVIYKPIEGSVYDTVTKKSYRATFEDFRGGITVKTQNGQTWIPLYLDL
jgi:hypothetical protein